MYNNRNMKLMGEVYHSLLYVLNKRGNNPFSQGSDIFPYKYLTMVIKQASQLGIPKELNEKIAELMDEFEPEEIEKLINEPSPIELRAAWHYGYMLAER